jgi:hypothetical protein
MTFLALVPAIYYNVKQYGAAGDGSTDDTSAIAAAMSAANSAGGTVFFPAGTYITGNQTLYSKVHLLGAGIEATIIQLKNASNADLLSASTGSINLSASYGSGSAGGVYNWSIQNLTLDGNKANQSSGTSWCLRVYGYGYILRDLRVRNGYSGGIQSDWNGGSTSPGQDAMEAQWSNVKVHDNAGVGIQLGGPHDSQLVNVISYGNDSHCFHFAPNATRTLVQNCHGWKPKAAVTALAYLIEADLLQFSNCMAEGADTTNVVLLGNRCAWIGGSIFATASPFTVTGLQIGQNAGGTPIPGQINQSGGVTTAVGTAGCVIETVFSRCEGTNGAIQFVNDGGNFIIAQCYLTAGTGYTGSVGASMFWFRVNGISIDGSRGHGGVLLFNASAYSATTFTDTNTGNDVFNINTNAFRFEMPNATRIRMYSDNYSTQTLDINNGVLSFGSAADTTIQRSAANIIGINGAVAVGQSASAPAIANSGTITTAGTGEARVAPTGNVTGIILQAGSVAGQQVIVVNESAFSVTFAAVGTSNVADGTSAAIAANRCMVFVWDSSTSKWYHS